MLIISLAVLAVIQVSSACVDNEHVVNPFDAHHQHTSCPHGPALPPPPPPCGCNPPEVPPSPYEPYIQSLTKIGHCPWNGYGPCLQSAVHSPLFCDPLVPLVENHVGHHLIKTVKHVPVIKKFCKPELVIRTRHVPVVRHKKRIFFEPYTIHIPITDRLIRQVIHQYQTKVPVVYKTVKPYTYQTVRHVPASYAKFYADHPCNTCPGDHFPPHFPAGPQSHPYPPFPLPLPDPTHPCYP